jgi:hypothetical protein
MKHAATIADRTQRSTPEDAAAANPYPLPLSSRRLTGLAWAATLLVSSLPDIIWDTWTGAVPAWLWGAKLSLLLTFGLAALIVDPLRPLRNYFLIMAAMFGLSELRGRLNFSLDGLQRLFGGSVFDQRMQAEQIGKLAVALAVMATLFALGYRRRSAFLARGELRAPIEPVRLLGFPKADPWPRFGLQWAAYIALGLAAALYLTQRPNGATLLKVVPILPSILFYAALNAFNEEVTYRVPMLATLEPIGGSRQAMWMAAYFFGIAHYFGTPGGIVGAIVSIFMGWILGKAMVETRGLFWSWWIHVLSDVVIFIFLAATLIEKG